MSALTSDDIHALREALDLAEIVDCDCPVVLIECDCAECQAPDKRGHKKGRRARKHADFRVPCEHLVAAQFVAQLSQEEWDLCQEAIHREPPAPGARSLSIEREAVVGVMAERYASHVGLFHAGDAWRPENLGRWAVSVRSAGRPSNGVGLREGGLYTQGEDTELIGEEAMVTETDGGKFEVMVGGHCYGRYRTRERAERRLAQVLRSQGTGKVKEEVASLPPWKEGKKP